ncbi:MAG: DUF2147 domain-containing protein [Gammaproteobacteria bacterium]|nr:DUF2147 domain-containing protein [Gammaproteobacteria bacterium]
MQVALSRFPVNNIQVKGLLGAALTISLFITGLSTASANDAIGMWRTESSERGYLHIEFKQCDDSICGTIHSAYDLNDEPNVDYEHVGKKMVWDMNATGDGRWVGGKIWDPVGDKTYKSKMSLSGDELAVSGCVMVFCRSQTWTRVQ